uniref:LysR family transcriptional regulator n=1 Tax=Edaphosphingomonas laterariae TaxID=861865 RepID=UPI001FEA5E1E|nr:LysR family transcriptional regulator [Sphingomonas laterariae]
MEQPTSCAPLAAPPDRARWTPAKQRIFLVALLECGSVARAARAAGMSRSSAHRLRARLAGTAFDRAWDQARAAHARRLADPFGPDALPTPPSPSAVATPGRR